MPAWRQPLSATPDDRARDWQPRLRPRLFGTRPQLAEQLRRLVDGVWDSADSECRAVRLAGVMIHFQAGKNFKPGRRADKNERTHLILR